MPKPSKQIIIDAIIKGIEQGKSYSKVMAVNGSKWQLSERTFNRYWKLANEQHNNRQHAIKRELAEVDKQAAVNARKKAIMTAEERKEYLTKIINGHLKFKKPFVISGKIMEYPAEPDAIERLKALAELNKMDGSYAVNKVEHSGEVVQKIIIEDAKNCEPLLNESNTGI